MGFVEIGTKNELMDGHMKMISISGHEILIARVGDNYSHVHIFFYLV
ncbi:MAG: hypothetical protein PQ975_11360 [Methanobacterium sp.]|jgi:3-phenylpropionate/trans-cinnamate dioxygenase ferredoxin subunit